MLYPVHLPENGSSEGSKLGSTSDCITASSRRSEPGMRRQVAMPAIGTSVRIAPTQPLQTLRKVATDLHLADADTFGNRRLRHLVDKTHPEQVAVLGDSRLSASVSTA